MTPRKKADTTPEGEIDLSRTKPPRDDGGLSAWINATIDADYESDASRRGPWPVVSPSMLGGDCLRQVAFEYERERELWARFHAMSVLERKANWRNPDLKFPGRMLRLFGDGNILEDRAVEDLAKAGFRLMVKDECGKQFGFRACDDSKGWARFRGRIDGVVMISPTPLVATPALWECKSMNAKKFKAFKEKGLKESNPNYYVQAQLYMWYLNLSANPCLFTVYSKDDSSYAFELVPFDPEVAQRASDDAVRVLEAPTPFDIPRTDKAFSPDKPPCSWCRFRDKCWNEPRDAIVPASIPTPSWLGS